MYYTLRCCREMHAKIEISVITPRFRLSTDTSEMLSGNEKETEICLSDKKQKKKTERLFHFS